MKLEPLIWISVFWKFQSEERHSHGLPNFGSPFGIRSKYIYIYMLGLENNVNHKHFMLCFHFWNGVLLGLINYKLQGLVCCLNSIIPFFLSCPLKLILRSHVFKITLLLSISMWIWSFWFAISESHFLI